MDHILDTRGYDHILFVIALASIYVARDWKKVLILVTAFTIGHSITLALATLEVIGFDSDLVEFLIPVTIFITALANIFSRSRTIKEHKIQPNYILALFFGLIHGMGFSNYLRALLGGDESIVVPLLSFNIGIEVGQIIIVLLFMVASFVFVDIFRVNRRDWRLVISSAIMGISLLMMLDNWYWAKG